MKFILTKELGRLARWLRVLGYDSIYYDSNNKSKLVIISLRDRRIILTRDSKISRFTGIRIVHISDDMVEKQLEQIIKELKLEISKDKTFLRCIDCNELLIDLERNKVKDKVPSYVFKTQKEFKMCPSCTKIFWKGTHWKLVKIFLKKHKLEKCL